MCGEDLPPVWKLTSAISALNQSPKCVIEEAFKERTLEVLCFCRLNLGSCANSDCLQTANLRSSPLYWPTKSASSSQSEGGGTCANLWLICDHSVQLVLSLLSLAEGLLTAATAAAATSIIIIIIIVIIVVVVYGTSTPTASAATGFFSLQPQSVRALLCPRPLAVLSVPPPKPQPQLPLCCR